MRPNREHALDNRYGSGAWSGEDVSDFIAVSIYTGLRISESNSSTVIGKGFSGAMLKAFT